MNMKKIFILAVSVLIATFSTVLNAQEITYTGHIKQMFDEKCLSCHGPDAAPEYDAFKADKEKWLKKGQGMRMDSYSHLVFYTAWADTGSLMRRLDDGKNRSDGKPGNMYQYLGSSDEERQRNLAVFKSWVGNWVLKRWPEITKEELNGIKVKY